MSLPSISIRVTELHNQLDALLGWTGSLPNGVQWRRQLNELRFVRATLAWEEFIEQSFVCFLRGGRSAIGRAYALLYPAAKNAVTAVSLAIGTSHFGKWLNEKWTLARASVLFAGPHPYASLSSPQFPQIRAIRNRIVHRSASARIGFQQVVLSVYGSAMPGMTPGRLLTDLAGGASRIDTYLQLLKNTGTLVAQ